MPARNDSYLNVWDDTVKGRDLLIALGISTPLSLGGYIFAPGAPPMPLIMGLSGAIIGFFINSVLFRPKRQLDVEGDDRDGRADLDMDEESCCAEGEGR